MGTPSWHSTTNKYYNVYTCFLWFANRDKERNLKIQSFVHRIITHVIKICFKQNESFRVYFIITFLHPDNKSVRVSWRYFITQRKLWFFFHVRESSHENSRPFFNPQIFTMGYHLCKILSENNCLLNMVLFVVINPK